MMRVSLAEQLMQFPTLHERLEFLFWRGDFAGHRIVVVDDDNPRYKNVYEDIESEPGQRERQCVVSFYPDCGQSIEDGIDPSCDQEVITHSQALRDIKKMLRLGWSLALIEAD